MIDDEYVYSWYVEGTPRQRPKLTRKQQAEAYHTFWSFEFYRALMRPYSMPNFLIGDGMINPHKRRKTAQEFTEETRRFIDQERQRIKADKEYLRQRQQRKERQR